MTVVSTTSTSRPLWALAGLTVSGALALSACAPDEPAEFDDTETESTSETEETETPETEEENNDDDSDTTPVSESGDEDAAEDAEPDDAGNAQDENTDPTETEESSVVDPEDAVETVTYPIVHDDIEGEMTVGFHHLRVEGETMELLLTYTPEFDEHGAYNLWHLHNRSHYSVEPVLYDRENLKRYNVLRSGGNFDIGHWATNQADVDVASGETQAYWANFAAPEDDISTINLGMPLGPEFKDIEIEWGDSQPSDQDTEAEDFDEDEDAAEESGDEDGE